MKHAVRPWWGGRRFFCEVLFLDSKRGLPLFDDEREGSYYGWLLPDLDNVVRRPACIPNLIDFRIRKSTADHNEGRHSVVEIS